MIYTHECRARLLVEFSPLVIVFWRWRGGHGHVAPHPPRSPGGRGLSLSLRAYGVQGVEGLVGCLSKVSGPWAQHKPQGSKQQLIKPFWVSEWMRSSRWSALESRTEACIWAWCLATDSNWTPRAPFLCTSREAIARIIWGLNDTFSTSNNVYPYR